MFPNVNRGIASHFNLKENEIKLVIEKYKALDLNLEYLTNENKSLKKVLNAEDISNVSNIVYRNS